MHGEFENRAHSYPIGTGFDPDNRGVGCPVTNLTRFHGGRGKKRVKAVKM